MKENNTYNEELGGKNLPDSLRVNPFLTPNNFFEEQTEQILNQIRFQRILGDLNENQNTNATSNIPKGYFDTLENSIFAKIAEQDLKSQISEDGFTVPNLYFDELNQDIEATIAEENLKSLVPTLNFEIPQGYFDSTEDQIIAKIAERQLRDQVGSQSGFTVPTSYFEDAPNEIEAKIRTENWSKELSSQHFTVPVGYFEQLNNKILAKISDRTELETPVRTLPKRISWRKYSAAAAIALIVSFGSYFGFQYNKANQPQNHQASAEINLENVSDEEILNYLAQVSDGEDLIHLSQFASDTEENNIQLDSNIDNKEIEEYLNYML